MRARTKKKEVSTSLIPTRRMHEYPSCYYCDEMVIDWCAIYKSVPPVEFTVKQNDCEFFKDSLSD